MRIRLLRCGTMSVPRGLSRRELPVTAFLVDHPRGPVLVDTGWSRAACPAGAYDPAAARRVLPARLAALYRPCLPPGQAAAEQLAALGLRPADLACVIVTHLDPDHACGLRELAGARRLLVPEPERFWSCRTVYALRQPRSLWDGLPLEAFYYRGTPWGPVRRSFDVFGDESLVLVSTPGYTEGLCTAWVRSGDRYALLQSDVADSPAALAAGELPAGGFNREFQRRSLLWLRAAAADPACAALFCGHDPAESRREFEL